MMVMLAVMRVTIVIVVMGCVLCYIEKAVNI